MDERRTLDFKMVYRRSGGGDVHSPSNCAFDGLALTMSPCFTPICAQCGTPMKFDRIEPHTKLPGALLQTFRCDTCRLMERVMVSASSERQYGAVG